MQQKGKAKKFRLENEIVNEFELYLSLFLQDENANLQYAAAHTARHVVQTVTLIAKYYLTYFAHNLFQSCQKR